MSTGAIAAYGTLLKVGDGGTSETFTTIAEVRDISGPSLSADVKDVTSHDSEDGWDESITTILRGGEVTFNVNFVPTDTTHSYSSGLINDMVDRTKRNFQLVFPDSGSTTWNFAALVTGFETTANVADELTADVTLKISGKPTLA